MRLTGDIVFLALHTSCRQISCLLLTGRGTKLRPASCTGLKLEIRDGTAGDGRDGGSGGGKGGGGRRRTWTSGRKVSGPPTVWETGTVVTWAIRKPHRAVEEKTTRTLVPGSIVSFPRAEETSRPFPVRDCEILEKRRACGRPFSATPPWMQRVWGCLEHTSRAGSSPGT